MTQLSRLLDEVSRLGELHAMFRLRTSNPARRKSTLRWDAAIKYVNPVLETGREMLKEALWDEDHVSWFQIECGVGFALERGA